MTCRNYMYSRIILVSIGLVMSMVYIQLGETIRIPDIIVHVTDYYA